MRLMHSVSRCSAGVGSRERNEQGAEHYVTAVANAALSEMSEQILRALIMPDKI